MHQIIPHTVMTVRARDVIETCVSYIAMRRSKPAVSKNRPSTPSTDSDDTPDVGEEDEDEMNTTGQTCSVYRSKLFVAREAD